jgi:hypothetical protein
MSLKKVIASVAVSAMTAGSLVPLSSAASADEWGQHGRGRAHASVPQFQRNFDNDGGRINRWGEQRQYNAWRGGDGDEGGYHRHRNHDGRNLAIGAFAAIMGIALAAEASKVHNNYYDERD